MRTLLCRSEMHLIGSPPPSDSGAASCGGLLMATWNAAERSMVGRSRSFAESCKPLAYRSPYLSSEAAAPRPRRHFAQLGHSLRRPILPPPSCPLFRAMCAMNRPSEGTLLGGMHRASRPEPHRNLLTQRCRRRPSPATPRATRDAVPVTPRLSSAPARRRSRLHDAPCQVRCVRGLFRGGAAHFVCAEGGPETRIPN